MNYLGMCAALLVASISGTLTLLFVVRRLPVAKSLRDNNDIVGIYFTLIGTIYAILLAFMLANVWTRFDQASSQVEQEAAALVNMYHLADDLPSAERKRLQGGVRAYTQSVIAREWPQMQQHKPDAQTDRLHHQLWHDTQAMNPRSPHDTNIHAQMLQQMIALSTLRRLRLLASSSGLPGILWFVLITGAALLIGMTALFGTETYAHHSFKASLLTTILILVLYATWEIDGPFSGNITVPPQAFQEALSACNDVEALRIGQH